MMSPSVSSGHAFTSIGRPCCVSETALRVDDCPGRRDGSSFSLAEKSIRGSARPANRFSSHVKHLRKHDIRVCVCACACDALVREQCARIPFSRRGCGLD